MASSSDRISSAIEELKRQFREQEWRFKELDQQLLPQERIFWAQQQMQKQPPLTLVNSNPPQSLCQMLSSLRDQMETFKVELRFLKTFLNYINQWTNADKVVPNSGSLAIKIEAVMEEIGADLTIASEIKIGSGWASRFSSVFSNLGKRIELGIAARQKKNLEETVSRLMGVISNLLAKIDLLKQEIRAAYDDLWGQPFQSQSPLHDYPGWDEFIISILQNFRVLRLTILSSSPLGDQIAAFDEELSKLRSFLGRVADGCNYCFGHVRNVEDLLAYVGAVAIDAAHLSCFCWVDGGMDSNRTEDVYALLCDLKQRIDPTSPEFLELNLGLLKALKGTRDDASKGDQVEFFVKYLIGRKKRVGFHEPLENVISFLINKPDHSSEDSRSLLSDVKAVVNEVRSLEYFLCGECGGTDDEQQDFRESSTEVVREVRSRINYSLCRRCGNNRALFQLFARIWLMEAEVFLTQQISNGSNFMLIVNDKIEALNAGVRFLRAFVLDSLEVNTGNGKGVLKLIETVAEAVTSGYQSFHTKRSTRNNLRDVFSKLLVEIVLFKSESLFMELITNNGSLIVPAQNRLRTLQEGLQFLMALVTCQPEEKTEDVKLIFTHMEVVARGVISLFYLFPTSKVTQEVIKKNDLLLADLVDKISLVKVELKRIYARLPQSYFPKIDGLGFIDSLVSSLRELLNTEAASIAFMKHQLEEIFGDLEFLRNIVEQHLEHDDMEHLGKHVIDLLYEAEHVIDLIMTAKGVKWHHFSWLYSILEETRLIKMQVTKTYEAKVCNVGDHSVSHTSRHITSQASTPIIDEVVVGLTDQEELIIDQLTRGSLQRDIVSIVGMPGIGKTTLARKVFNHPNVTHYFHVCAWCYVSQVHRKRDLLLDILGDIIVLTDDVLQMPDEDLELELYKKLRRKRYLIIMDDIWNTVVWDELSSSFPNDANGSRILITSRLHDVPLKVKSDRDPHWLRLLFDDESWKLLHLKVFHDEYCPEELLGVGKQIASNCKGLPLAIVAIAGLLEKTDKKQESWKKIAETLSSLIVEDPQTRCKEILELSYKSLPYYLKPCFLYFGAFKEDKDIAISRLIRLWIAEGFIRKEEPKSLEDLAQDYLMDLIGRSLVIVVKRRSNGGVKACRVHDLLRDLCLIKAKEENFLQLITPYDDQISSLYGSDFGDDFDCYAPLNHIEYEVRRLCIFAKKRHFVTSRPSGPRVHSLMFIAATDKYQGCSYDMSFICDNFKRLRVLDIESINFGNSFPNRIESLVQLRYLAISGDIYSVPPSIAKLGNLETFLLKGLKGKVILPNTIWCMTKLRHVHVNDYAVFDRSGNNLGSSSQLDNLVTLSSPSLSCGKDTNEIMRRMPNLKKMRCIFLEAWNYYENRNQFPVLHSLAKLESLKISYLGRAHSTGEFSFPLNLKKLTLSNFHLPWDQISAIGRLPNLEVLKLLSKAFDGQRWDMREGEFLKLKFLKLDSLNIAQWNALNDHLPNLQELVLRSCNNLQEVPFSFAEIPTLQLIEVQCCGICVEESVKRIEEEGIEGLKFLINRSDMDFRSLS